MREIASAENLSSCSFFPFCAYAATAAAAAIMFRIGGQEKATDLAWRLPRRRLGSRPPWSEGVCSLANLPSKTHVTNNPQRLLTRRDLNGRQWRPWCPTPTAAAYNSRPVPLKQLSKFVTTANIVTPYISPYGYPNGVPMGQKSV